jgi:hypothetical protein
VLPSEVLVDRSASGAYTACPAALSSGYIASMKEDPTIGGGTLGRVDAYPEHLRLLGLIVTEFAQLEVRMSLAMWALLGAADTGTTVFYSISTTGARVKMLENLARELTSGAVREEFKATFSEISAVSGERNLLVHGQWGVIGDPTRRADPFIQDYRMNSGKTPLYAPTIVELQGVANRIAKVDDRLAFITGVLEAKRNPHRMAHEMQLRAQFPHYEARWKPFD